MPDKKTAATPLPTTALSPNFESAANAAIGSGSCGRSCADLVVSKLYETAVAVIREKLRNPKRRLELLMGSGLVLPRRSAASRCLRPPAWGTPANFLI